MRLFSLEQDKWLRVLGIPLIGFCIPFITTLTPTITNSYPITALSHWLCLCIVAIIFESNRWILSVFRKRYPNLSDTVKRITYQLSTQLVWTFLVLYIILNFWYSWFLGLDDYQNYMRNNIYVGLSLPLIITLLYESAYFMKKWKSEFLKRQQLSEENAKAELQILKKQLDPHFMFNALGTLSSLIEDKPKQATDFVNEFSDVYRYILTNKDQNLAFLKDEITFVKSYITLLRYRFGNRVLLFDFNISSSYLNYKFPTLTLQMLIENAVKHNAFSEAKPLQVAISINEKKHTLCVKNNKQQKSRQVNSTGIGLENIAKRYALLTKNKISIKQDIESFEVCLPLI